MSSTVIMRMRSHFANESARYRWSIASRALAAIFGGYGLTVLFNLALPLLLGAMGVNVPQAFLATTTASFVFYAAVIMGVFHASSATRAWVWVVGLAGVIGVVTWALWPEVSA